MKCRLAAKRRLAIAVFAGSLSLASHAAAQPAPADEDLRVLAEWMLYSDAPNALYHHFREQAETMLERRRASVDDLRSASDWSARQEDVRRALSLALGPFPERTPLSARVTGVVERPGFRVERVVYESQPSFYVTAALYVPAGLEAPAPAILFCSGHSADGFRAPAYQTMISNLARKGFVVLAFDPVGQGERVQYFDGSGEPRFGPTKQHSYPGAQQLAVGRSPAWHMIWDGMRGIDYLVSREDVDPERIGVAGRSGGGTQTAFIAALDDRVVAAAPEAYITSYQRLLSSRGPQDAEQNFLHGIALGLDHADLLEVRAPKPTLVITTTRDIFSIQGARETVSEAGRAFAALGASEKLEKVEDDAAHASTRANREAMYGFFQRHLGVPGSAEEDATLAPLDPGELQVTPTGQVATSLAGESVFSLNARASHALSDGLEAARTHRPSHLDDVRRSAVRLSGFVAPAPSAPVFTGRYRREGYRVEKYFIPSEGETVVPVLLFVPDGDGPFDSVVYLHPEGKAAESHPGGEIETLVREGYAVAAPDLLGIGELGPGRFRGDAYFDGTSYNTFFAAMLVGRSIVGVRAAEAIRVAAVVRDLTGGTLRGIARGAMGPVLLHAAALDPGRSFDAVVTLDSLLSYRSFVETRDYRPELVPALVAGALTAYDLPDLAASFAPRPLYVGGAVDGAGGPPGERERAELAFIDRAYRVAGGELVVGSAGLEGVLRFLRSN